MPHKFYTVKEIADLLNVTETYVRKQMYDGKITYRKIGRMVRITNEDFTEYINQDVRQAVANG